MLRDGGKNVAAFSFNKVHRLVETVFASSPPRARRTLPPPVIVSSPIETRAATTGYCSGWAELWHR
ncbi:hypothetical protein WN51_11656 [Melipona quadrifasciata]|uniref:Uncharacterized protein n=1 Tax=Melipona quadrifasciata TaxID=166423 RepID=A0A0M9A368_9HYME|nr:hypothetical protein WN51_11656 [Melipona quadrifasciata]